MNPFFDGPTDYIVCTTPTELLARAIVEGINRYGFWTAIYYNDDGNHRVMLPGQCTQDTEPYMRGFIDGFMLHWKEK